MSRHPHTDPPDQEQLLVIVTGAVAAACILVWTAGQLTGRIWGGHWPQASPLNSPLILARLITNPTDPSTAWPAPAADLIPAPAAYYPVLVLLVVAATIIAVLAWRLWQSVAAPDDDGARWAKPRDLKPLLVRHPEPGRLTLGTVNGKLIATEAQHSVAVIGPAGTGKTTGFAIPALLEWDGPVLATSVKGDLLEDTIAHRRSLGETWVFDPVNSTAEPSAGWSPLHASGDWQGALRMAAWLASTARAGERGGLQDSDFW
ncbi:MAG: type IV secretory system conjugative DNA transfer family protein, partial [Acidobacteria bacterium]|nr:type IV secretory system conjugative DNA transfer family protein [Acidobacteriota bacterium]